MQPDSPQNDPYQRGSKLLAVAFLGTLVGAALFGLIEGGVIGFVVGPIYATLAALFVLPSVFAVAWALWLLRFHLATSFVAGAITGVVCTMRVYEEYLFRFPYDLSVVLAAGIGGAGAVCSVGLAIPAIQNSSRIVFSLADLFRRMTVLCAILAVWIFLVNVVREHDVRVQERQEELQRQMDEVYAND